MANLILAVSIRSFNPGPDRWCARTGLGTDEQQPPGCQVGSRQQTGLTLPFRHDKLWICVSWRAAPNSTVFVLHHTFWLNMTDNIKISQHTESLKCIFFKLFFLLSKLLYTSVLTGSIGLKKLWCLRKYTLLWTKNSHRIDTGIWKSHYFHDNSLWTNTVLFFCRMF